MQETQGQSLGWEDPLEKEMETHSSTLVWKILWMEEPGRLQSMGLQMVGHDWATSLSLSSFSFHIIVYVQNLKELRSNYNKVKDMILIYKSQSFPSILAIKKWIWH